VTSLQPQVVPRLRLEASLGEGLHWDHRHGVLWGVDIHGRTVWCWDTVSDAPTVWQLSQRVGWVLPVNSSEKLLLGLQEGFALADRSDPRKFEWLNRPFAGQPHMRLNDAKADSTGAVWAGSLNNDDESRTDGCLYRLSPGGEVRRVDDGYKVTNGPAIRNDGKLFLHTDSGSRTIYAFDLDGHAGTLVNKRIWMSVHASCGYPDGMCFDSENCVWIAHWGAGCVCRYTVDARLLTRIEVPVSHVTNICFGGPNLDRIFVSTARIGLSSAALSQQPLAGTVFEIVDTGVKGLKPLSYKLDKLS
jgi:D-xylonolactonase